jgi:hypothetical protein
MRNKRAKRRERKRRRRRKKEKTMIRRGTSVLGLFLFFLALPPGLVQGGEISWHPRTPAGGASVIDADYYIQMLDKAESGPSRHQVTETFDGHPFKKGYFEIMDDGRVVYFDLDGNRIDARDVAIIEDDPDNPPNGVVFYTAPKQVVTY